MGNLATLALLDRYDRVKATLKERAANARKRAKTENTNPLNGIGLPSWPQTGVIVGTIGQDYTDEYAIERMMVAESEGRLSFIFDDHIRFYGPRQSKLA